MKDLSPSWQEDLPPFAPFLECYKAAPLSLAHRLDDHCPVAYRPWLRLIGASPPFIKPVFTKNSWLKGWALPCSLRDCVKPLVSHRLIGYTGSPIQRSRKTHKQNKIKYSLYNEQLLRCYYYINLFTENQTFFIISNIFSLVCSVPLSPRSV